MIEKKEKRDGFYFIVSGTKFSIRVSKKTGKVRINSSGEFTFEQLTDVGKAVIEVMDIVY